MDESCKIPRNFKFASVITSVSSYEWPLHSFITESYKLEPSYGPIKQLASIETTDPPKLAVT